MPNNPVFTPVDNSGNVLGTAASPLQTSAGGTATATVPSGVGNTVIKNTAGRLCRIVVTTGGTGAVTFYDNASTNSGTVLFIVPGSAATGATYDVQMPAVNGIVAAGSTSSSALTVSFA